ncbi:MAG: RND family efflux transporter MFP subunit [Phenylobacterium sp.]|jgi:RND family efflux transporter MFP subunit
MNITSTQVKKLLLPVVIIAVTVIAAKLIMSNPPESKRRGPSKANQMMVEVKTLAPQSYQVMLDSFGTVQPRTQSMLVAQVSGQIRQVSSQFRDGGFFEKGDVLVTLDDRDYQAEVKIAQSTLMAANQTLLEEQARVKQALADWQRLGNGQAPGDLVLRKPQLGSAQAKVLSAEAQLDKARLAVERSQVMAPYAGRILKKNVDLGQVVSPNSQLATIYAVDTVEIRLPLKNNDLALANLPEAYRNKEGYKEGNSTPNGLPVSLRSDLIGDQVWQGQVIRTEGAIDGDAQQLYIVAQISDPYNPMNQTTPIKIGQYVSAQITGKQLEAAMVIPNSAIYQGSYVYIVQDGVLLRRDVTTRWKNAQDAIIATGLEFGEKLVLTSLGQVSSGTPVGIVGETPIRKKVAKAKADGGSL